MLCFFKVRPGFYNLLLFFSNDLNYFQLIRRIYHIIAQGYGRIIMEPENISRKKTKKPNNFYIPPPARKSENFHESVLHEPKSKDRTYEKLKCEGGIMKVCDNSSLLFKSDETDSSHDQLIKKNRKKQNIKTLSIDSDLNDLIDNNSGTLNPEVNRDTKADDFHSIENILDLSISTNVVMPNSKSDVLLMEKKISEINDKCISINLNDKDNLRMDSSLHDVANQSNFTDKGEKLIELIHCQSESILSNRHTEGDNEGSKNQQLTNAAYEKMSCHQPEKQFTDSLQSPGKDEVSGFHDDWEELLDKDDFQNLAVKSKISGTVAAVKKSKFKEEKEKNDEKEGDNCSIIEIYGFPDEFKTQDLYTSFCPYVNRGLQLEWVDNNHALGIFPSPIIADEVLSSELPFVKTRPLSQATLQSQEKAKHLVLPSSLRPKTCSALARRLVSGALGVKAVFTKAEIEKEKKMLKDAREQKRLAAKQRDAAWEGKF